MHTIIDAILFIALVAMIITFPYICEHEPEIKTAIYNYMEQLWD